LGKTPFWEREREREREIIILGRVTLDLKGEKVEAPFKGWRHSSSSLF